MNTNKSAARRRCSRDMAAASMGFQLPPSPPESVGESHNNTFSEASCSNDKIRKHDKLNYKGNREVRSVRVKKGSSVEIKTDAVKRDAVKKDAVKRAADVPKKNNLAKKAKGEPPKDIEVDNSRSEKRTSRKLTPGRDASIDSNDKDKIDDENDEKEYEVEDIMDYWKERGKESYLIKWLNWPEESNTWEERQNLNNCDDVLTSFFFKRVKEIRDCKKALKGKPGKLTSTLRNLPCPPDPRALSERVKHFFNANKWSLPNDEELETIFKDNRTRRKEAEAEWPRTKIDKYLLDHILGDLDMEDNCPQSLKNNLLVLMAENKYQDVQASLKEWEANLNRITNGMPSLTVINEIDFTGPAKDFVYVNEYVAGKGVTIPNDPPIGCACVGSCYKNKKTCCPANSEVKFAYSVSKRVIVEPGNAIYECNSNCKCDASCINRVVQNGTSVLKGTKFCIFKTENKGWGVKTMQTIKKGQFVAIYAGEVILSKEAEDRGKLYDREGLTYLFDLDFNDEDNQYTVDAKKMGNFSHFFNHSCDPNLAIYNVYVNCLDPNLPTLALFASRDIIKGEELCFDYKSKNEQEVTNNNYACHCNSENCRKFFL